MEQNHQQKAEEIRREIYRNMSFEEKYEQLMMLREFAWDLKAAAIRESHPELCEEEIRKRVAKVFIRAST